MTVVGGGGRRESGVAMTNSKAEGDDGLSASSADQVRWFEVSPEAGGRQAPGGPAGRWHTREKPPQAGVFYNLVPWRGLEPPRSCPRLHLKLVHLSIPPPGRVQAEYVAVQCGACQRIEHRAVRGGRVTSARWQRLPASAAAAAARPAPE